MIISFSLFLSLFVAVGLSSFFFSQKNKRDYYLASGQVQPFLVGLSAVATNNSGYMFVGLMGYVYAVGLQSIWLMVGWIAGDFIASSFVHHRLKAATLRSGEVSYAGVLGNWYGRKSEGSASGDGAQPNLQRIIGLLSLVFLLAYAAAQLVAGAKALQVLLDAPAWAGAVMGAILVALYCFVGGIRASIWTDAAQSMVMICAMAILFWVALNGMGGVEASIAQMAQIDGFLDWFPSELLLPGAAGAILFVLGWMFAGFSVIGQPHVMVRFMTLNSDDNSASQSRFSNMARARFWYYLWFILFWSTATAVGMLSRLYLTDAGSFDSELALPTLAQQLLSPYLVGLILAGLFAATLSTADSLVLGCSAAISHDILPHKINNTQSTVLIKLTTVAVTGLALLWALVNSASVFDLVILAWSGLGSAFGPLLLVLCFGGRPTQNTSILMVLSGIAVALLWRYCDLHNLVYEGVPGMLMGFIVYGLQKLVNSKG
ncbi:MAG: sodium/proline symporter [Bermanella sp.]